LRLGGGGSSLECQPVWRSVLLAILATVLLQNAVSAQTLIGRVLEDGRDTPVSGALVSLLGREGEVRVQVLADSVGRFVLAPPEAGEFVVTAARFGYEPFRSPLFAMTTERSVPFDLLMQPSPLGLTGIDVSVVRERSQLLGLYGHTPATLGRRWIGRDKIESRIGARTPADVIRWNAPAGVYIPVSNSSPLNESLCVKTYRNVRGECALTVLNGVVVGRLQANQIDPQEIEAIALLSPMDATTFYGTIAGGGAVLIWTRQGRR